MKYTIHITTVILVIVQTTFAQAPLVKMWDKRFGGTEHEWLSSFQQTNDGGYILGGYSNSDSSGDKSEDRWTDTIYNAHYFDYWVVKIDSVGNKQWDKRFGGTWGDYLYSLQQTTDGGYILGGRSLSVLSGDKTQPSATSSDDWRVVR